MQGVFPEALSSLKNADPELFSIIEDEKERQWYVTGTCGALSVRRLRSLLVWWSTPVITFLQEGHRADSFRELHVNACH